MRGEVREVLMKAWFETDEYHAADAVLCEHLTPAQRAQWEEFRWFTHDGALGKWRFNPYRYFRMGVPEFPDRQDGHYITLTRAEYEMTDEGCGWGPVLLRDVPHPIYDKHPIVRNLPEWNYAGCFYYPDGEIPTRLLGLLMFVRYREANVAAGARYQPIPGRW